MEVASRKNPPPEGIGAVKHTTKTKMTGASDEKTLAEFIKKNYPLLSSVGIFIALTVFTGSLKPSILGATLSLLFLTATVLTAVELIGWSLPLSMAFLLGIFERLLELSVFGLVFYWLLIATRVNP